MNNPTLMIGFVCIFEFFTIFAFANIYPIFKLHQAHNYYVVFKKINHKHVHAWFGSNQKNGFEHPWSYGIKGFEKSNFPNYHASRCHHQVLPCCGWICLHFLVLHDVLCICIFLVIFFQVLLYS